MERDFTSPEMGFGGPEDEDFDLDKGKDDDEEDDKPETDDFEEVEE